MTEEEWLTCPGPLPALEFVQGRVSDRKMRLIACEASRRINSAGQDEQKAIALAERWADQQATDEEVYAFNRATLGEPIADWIVLVASAGDSVRHLIDHNESVAKDIPVLLREVAGNPFRTVTLDPAWLTSTVVALAEGIYQDRAFERMSILADALQDAGCDNDDILSHCRSEGTHVRGCWVIDLLLGKV